MKRMLLAALSAITVATCAADSVMAGLSFRNNTSETIYLCLANRVSGSTSTSVGAYSLPAESPSGWRIDGWYRIRPGQTRTIMRGDLDSRYFYYYAHSRSKRWEGNYNFKIRRGSAFTYFERDDGTYGETKPGTVTQGFRQIDTGDYDDYTFRLN